MLLSPFDTITKKQIYLYDMVLLTLIDLSANIVIWSASHVYHAGYWMLYGTPKTETHILLEQQNETIKQLQQDLKEIKEMLIEKESVPEER